MKQMTTYTSKKTAPNELLAKVATLYYGKAPLIDRTTKTNFGYGVEQLTNTVRVRLGRRTLYYSRNAVSQFEGRVYRLISRPNTKDYIIRPVKR